jgi:hypothetical protein
VTPKHQAIRDVAKMFLADQLSRCGPVVLPTRGQYLILTRMLDTGAKGAPFRKDFAHHYAATVASESGVTKGRQGDWIAHVQLCRAAGLLTAYAEPLPPLLQEYMIVDALTFKRRRGRRTGGDHPNAKVAIAAAVAMLVNSGLNRTRNRYTRSSSPTACSIVVEILQELRKLGITKITKTEAAVEKICEQHRHCKFRFAPAYENKPGI